MVLLRITTFSSPGKSLPIKHKCITAQPLIEDIKNIIEHDITTGVCYIEFVEELNEQAKLKNKIAKIHIEIETGMGRTGVQKSKLKDFINRVKMLKNIQVEGVYTHFATRDSDLDYAKSQMEKFNKAVEFIKSQMNTVKYVHIGNSAGSLNLENLARKYDKATE